MRQSYSVIYRDGGTINFKWHRVGGTYDNSQEADNKAAEIERMGYKTYVYKTQELDKIGMPETY